LLVFTKHDPFLGMNAGFVALVVNAVVTVAVSRIYRTREKDSGQPV